MCDLVVSVVDGQVLFAKNSDRDPNEAQRITWHPSEHHAAGSQVTCTFTSIPQARRTHAVMLSRPWWMWGAEMGTNSHGLVIGNAGVFTRRTRERRAGETLVGMDFVRLALERASTAHEAVGVIVDLLERHGQGRSTRHEHPGHSYDSSYLLADGTGAYVLETAGRRHATERLTSGSRAISNELTVTGFRERFRDPVASRLARARGRRACTEPAAARANGPADMFAVLRSHGGPAPRWNTLDGGFRAPCAHAGGLLVDTQTTASWVSRIDGTETEHWASGTAAPCTSIFKPVDWQTPLDIEPGDLSRTFDDASLWWRHELLHRWAVRDARTLATRVTAERAALEDRWIADPPSPRDAFLEADQLEAQWLRGLLAARPRDRRPRAVRARWRRADRAAVLTYPAVLAEDRCPRADG